MNRRKKGFTLMEMLIVVAIIGVLVAVAIPTFTGSLDRAREATCAANRRSLQAQLAVEQMLTQAKDLEAVSNTEQGKAWLNSFVCPSGGSVTVENNLISCSKHGGTASIEATVRENFSDIVENWEKYSKDIKPPYKHLNNDNLRKYYREKYGDWPPVVLNGETYYVQPYYDSGSESSYLFAQKDQVSASNWFTYCIYDADEGRWYTGNKNNGFSIAGKSWTIVKAEIDKQVESGKWAPVK
ncbi:MAG: prepilin-type N-terminal cleavage/methylation domain-containing protein [Oscillibacter sp.]